MSRSRLENERLDRLASEVKKGGGLPLPSFFAAILHELLDNGPADDDRLTAVIAGMGNFKSKKVAENWGHTDRDQWEYLTSDLVEQLAGYGYIARNGDGRWHIGEKFTPGARMETVPARKGLNTDDGVVVWPKEERDALDQVRKTNTAIADLIRQPRGRSHGPVIVNDLRASYEKFGPLQRIVEDAHGRTLDGRHRREIDRDWPVHRAEHIETDEQAIGAILELDRWHRYEKLSPETVEKLTEVLGRAPTQNEIKRGLVTNELQRDATRSNRTIAEHVGVSDMFVGKVRVELVCANGLHKYEFPGSTQVGKHSAECWCGKGNTEPPAPPTPKQPSIEGHLNNPATVAVIADLVKSGRGSQSAAGKQLAKELGIPQQTFRFVYERVAGRLEMVPPEPGPEPEVSHDDSVDESVIESEPEPCSHCGGTGIEPN